MQYFENLPIININDKQVRNLFKKIVVDNIEENQLINYRIKDYETLTSISYDLYGSVNYWWVIALMNNIQDINFGIPLNNEQIEMIASDLATETTFNNSIIESGTFNLENSMTQIVGDNEFRIKEITFNNSAKKDYAVIVTPVYEEYEEIRYLGEYGCNKLNYNTFRFMTTHSIPSQTFSYVIFGKPITENTVMSNDFINYYNALLRESDYRRDIRLLKAPHLNEFISKFMNALNEEKLSVKTDYYYSENYLKKFVKKEKPENGIYVDKGEDTFEVDKKFATLNIRNHDVDNHIYLTSEALIDELGHVGAMGVRHIDLQPRIYRTGITTNDFEYLILSPKNSKYSEKKEIIQSGIGRFAGRNNDYLISINDSRIENIKDIGVMVTPIVDDINMLGHIGKFGFKPIDKRSIFIKNTGQSGVRFFYSVYINNVYSNQMFLLGNNKQTTIKTNKEKNIYNSLTPMITISLTEMTSYKQPRLIDVGNISYMNDANKLNFYVSNSGISNMPFTYKILYKNENGVVNSDIDGIDVEISSYKNIRNAEDINMYLIFQGKETKSTEYVECGVRFIDKNNIRIISNGDMKIKYHLIADYLEHGIEYFNNNSYREIILSNHEEIENNEDILLMITPIYDNDLEIGKAGNYSYEVINKNTVRVYNTGENIRFKWCLVKAEKNG